MVETIFFRSDFMKKFVVNGGYALSGSVRVSGSKNAALPIIFATLITRGVSRISNIPYIKDVGVAIDLISRYGAKCSIDGGILTVNTESLCYTPPDVRSIRKIRASTYLIGACLARFGEYELSGFGGCSFSPRPIDLHLLAARSLGATECGNALYARTLRGCVIDFPKVSVGATVNAIIMSASAEGTTVIKNYAREPHVYALIDFLNSAGASITRGADTLTVEGRELHGGEYSLEGDMIEAGTYLVAGLITGGRVTVTGIPTDQLAAFTSTLIDSGARIDILPDAVTAQASGILKPMSVVSAPYPAFATDLQPIIAPLLAKNSGGTITDLVWRERFGYLHTLGAFGIGYTLSDNTARIEGSSFHSASVTSPDLRGGMAALLTALSAKGRSEIYSPELILRGYDSPVEKLAKIGANIRFE